MYHAVGNLQHENGGIDPINVGAVVIIALTYRHTLARGHGPALITLVREIT